MAVILDAKGKGRYDGLIDAARTAIRTSVAHVRSSPLLPGTRVLVFKGDPVTGRDLDVEEISQYAFGMVGGKPSTPVLLWHDELIPFAARFCQWTGGKGGWVERTFITGREFGLSVGYCATDLYQVPLQASGQSELWVLKSTPNDARLLRRRGYCTGVPAGTLEAILPGPPLPFAQRGVFVRLHPEREWDRRFYKF